MRSYNVQRNFLIWSLWKELRKVIPDQDAGYYPRSWCFGDFEKMLLTITKWKGVCIIAPVVKEVINCRNESLTVPRFLMLLNLSLPFVGATLENRRGETSALGRNQKKGWKYYFYLIFLPLECICISRTPTLLMEDKKRWKCGCKTFTNLTKFSYFFLV